MFQMLKESFKFRKFFVLELRNSLNFPLLVRFALMFFHGQFPLEQLTNLIFKYDMTKFTKSTALTKSVKRFIKKIAMKFIERLKIDSIVINYW